jgi:hypothetical protein
MLVTGTMAEWEEWAAMRFPESGAYVVPGALNPVEINREADQGRYLEPNVWRRHRLGEVSEIIWKGDSCAFFSPHPGPSPSGRGEKNGLPVCQSPSP